ncbi:MAG: hypothetical protein ABSA26_09665 [Thermoguttaceae bacterium]|jgi:hypothetical protein
MAVVLIPDSILCYSLPAPPTLAVCVSIHFLKTSTEYKTLLLIFMEGIGPRGAVIDQSVRSHIPKHFAASRALNNNLSGMLFVIFRPLSAAARSNRI